MQTVSGHSLRRLLGIACFAAAIAGAASAEDLPGGDPREALSLSAFQIVGTHNSYHIEPPREVFDLMVETDYRESASWPAHQLIPALSYTHLPIEKQLDLGIRLFELDIHDDPEGGRFARQGVYEYLRGRGARFDFELDPDGVLQRPGMKVFHAADTDVRSHCLAFRTCLGIIKAWSDAHPGHFPVFIQLETKETSKPAVAGAYEPAAEAPFTPESWERLHAEIFAVLPIGRVVTPRDVQGSYASVNEAVRQRGWPALSELRGKILFLLLDEDAKQRDYTEFATSPGHEMVLFPSLGRNDPHTGWLRRDNPKASDIGRRVREGFLVYTRADKHTDAARDEDFAQRDRALLSGAQLVATDFPVPDPRYSDYSVSISGRYVGCSRAYAPQQCAGDR